jgi:hypothetical protein
MQRSKINVNNFRIDYHCLLLSNTHYTFHIKVLAIRHFKLKHLHFSLNQTLSKLKRLHFSFNQTLCLSKTHVSLLGLLITFVNNFQFNLVVMFVSFCKSIFSSKLNLNEGTHFIIKSFLNYLLNYYLN